MGNDAKKVASAFSTTIKTMKFLGFFDDSKKLSIQRKDGKISSSCLDAFGQRMADLMTHQSHDRDLIVMRHEFTLEDNKTKERWGHNSTMIVSGESADSGGISVMSKSVGVTAAMGVRLVLEGKISQRGILSPTTPEIYTPILKNLEKAGLFMVEESERPDVSPNRPRL